MADPHKTACNHSSPSPFITRMKRPQFLIFAGLLLVASCSNAAEERRVASMVQPDASVASFMVCHGSGCRIHSETGLTDEEWSKIEEAFDPPAATAEAERKQIARAIGLFEFYVGPKTNTKSDAGRNRTDVDQATQLDCIDETVNTTTYLHLIEAAGLLRWHSVGSPAHRTEGLIDFHNTAVVVVQSDGTMWAVDSWFGPNASPPVIVPLDAWRAGWQPGRSIPTVASAGP